MEWSAYLPIVGGGSVSMGAGSSSESTIRFRIHVENTRASIDISSSLADSLESTLDQSMKPSNSKPTALLCWVLFLSRSLLPIKGQVADFRTG